LAKEFVWITVLNKAWIFLFITIQCYQINHLWRNSWRSHSNYD
jgi:hypothetical protein